MCAHLLSTEKQPTAPPTTTKTKTNKVEKYCTNWQVPSAHILFGYILRSNSCMCIKITNPLGQRKRSARATESSPSHYGQYARLPKRIVRQTHNRTLFTWPRTIYMYNKYKIIIITNMRRIKLVYRYEQKRERNRATDRDGMMGDVCE